MRKLLSTFVILGFAAAPALAQQAAPQAETVPQPQVKMVTKVVCQRVDVEATSGSRLSAPPKICKKDTVPADGTEAKNDASPTKAPQGR
jgi:Ni/Co efflux regulator RcnB